jgi:hypothetical protein
MDAVMLVISFSSMLNLFLSHGTSIYIQITREGDNMQRPGRYK